MILHHINDIASICAGHGVETAIISPGSRSAPLTLAFVRHPDIHTHIVPDERSAAFMALGIAQKQQKPVVLICTSGSAAYNYAPAIAEAFFQEIPLLVLTADRPPEWTDQYDGQTIRQSGIFGRHVKAAFDFPDNPTHTDIEWHGNRMVNEALIQSQDQPAGPVHINVPLREPFYPETDEQTFFRKVRIIEKTRSTATLSENDWQELADIWKNNPKRLLVAGQLPADSALSLAIGNLATQQQLPVISDIISNLHGLDNAILHQDAFLSPNLDTKNEALTPDLLITFGKSNISKNLKRFIRKHKPQHHWHIQAHDRYQDTFQSLSRLIAMDAASFFENFNVQLTAETEDSYLNQWQQRDQAVAGFNKQFVSSGTTGEFAAVSQVLQHIPEATDLHLANSMAVRYANFLGLAHRPGIEVFCNRGTSGIDGSNSTAVGSMLAGDRMVTLITGDTAFFYDRNAFWHNYPLERLRIIVLNNHGGGIFRMIKGPSDQPELEEYFETRQTLNAENTARDFGMEYQAVDNTNDLQSALAGFYENSSSARLIEITTDASLNTKLFKEYKQAISAQLS